MIDGKFSSGGYYDATWGLTTYATAEDAKKAAEAHAESAGDE